MYSFWFIIYDLWFDPKPGFGFMVSGSGCRPHEADAGGLGREGVGRHLRRNRLRVHLVHLNSRSSG